MRLLTKRFPLDAYLGSMSPNTPLRFQHLLMELEALDHAPVIDTKKRSRRSEILHAILELFAENSDSTGQDSDCSIPGTVQ